jgi:hypothetical protein
MLALSMTLPVNANLRSAAIPFDTPNNIALYLKQSPRNEFVGRMPDRVGASR